MLAPAIQGPVADGAVLPLVLAGGARGAHRQAETVPQSDNEMLVWHRLGHLILEGKRRLQKPTSARPASRPHVNLVVLGEASKQSSLARFFNPSRKKSLQLSLGFREQPHPV